MNTKITRIFAVIALAVLPIFAMAQKGESVCGVHTGYASQNNSCVIGLFYQYNFSDHFRVAPQIGAILRNDGMDAVVVDVNTLYPFAFSSRKVSLYPVAGINYSSWNRYGKDEQSNDVSSRVNRLGLNAGAGVDLKANETLKLKFECVYTLTRHYNTCNILIGIGYVF